MFVPLKEKSWQHCLKCKLHFIVSIFSKLNFHSLSLSFLSKTRQKTNSNNVEVDLINFRFLNLFCHSICATASTQVPTSKNHITSYPTSYPSRKLNNVSDGKFFDFEISNKVITLF